MLSYYSCGKSEHCQSQLQIRDEYIGKSCDKDKRQYLTYVWRLVPQGQRKD